MSATKDTAQEDDRYETEELLVYVDLDTKLLDDQLTKSGTKIKFLGIDTEHPIMQLNNQLFKGSYEYSMGTHCFFSESNRPGGVENACFRELPEKLYDFLAKTDKVLKMKRIFVEEKESESENAEQAEGEIEDLEHLRISKTYSVALNQFLKPGEEPPREIAQNSDESGGDDEDEHQMEIDQNTEETNDEPMDGPMEEPSENSETMKLIRKVEIEADAHQQLERLIDPDFEPSQSS